MTTLQTSRRAVPVPTPTPTPSTIEWATPAIAAPADPRLDPRPAAESTESASRRLRPLAVASSLRQSMATRRARRLAARPVLEPIFPVGHPGFELRLPANQNRSALVAPAGISAAADHASAALVDFDFQI